MDIIELTRKAVEVANQDEGLKEKIKDTVVTITMLLKNDEPLSITFSVDKGELKLIKGGIENPDFQFEISKKDFTKLMTGKAYGMILMATKKMKMTKGNWAEIGKIATPLGVIPKFGKEIAAAENTEKSR